MTNKREIDVMIKAVAYLNGLAQKQANELLNKWNTGLFSYTVYEKEYSVFFMGAQIYDSMENVPWKAFGKGIPMCHFLCARVAMLFNVLEEVRTALVIPKPK